ncbi:hypothetical protein NUH86_15945 [Sphingobium sp. JS3065]|uniref:hypothetical protein n=1 Tax=Sphingobium sp. JS3065 TaxID=2970925 RepID=UPI0022644C38|nr:hypothetical protein [Sphingobium sp. JS3065]UZW54946.1 hypothetical protein NUH86_15945 [Sphingobium sp. JS3065]
MSTFEQSLLAVSRIYVRAVAARGGKSLARVATIVVNHGSFFDRLERGATCTVRNLDKFAAYFSDAANWPEGVVPDDAADVLAGIGRPVKAGQPLSEAFGSTSV